MAADAQEQPPASYLELPPGVMEGAVEQLREQEATVAAAGVAMTDEQKRTALAANINFQLAAGDNNLSAEEKASLSLKAEQAIAGEQDINALLNDPKLKASAAPNAEDIAGKAAEMEALRQKDEA